ncbi:MAG TPA: hypothetical protein VN154_01750 [Rhizomicrobium sp.]|nr:hypothetical protein [Rhizomicrobium sp.]
MSDEKPHLTEAQIKEIAERRAEALKRVQELHHKAHKDLPPVRTGPAGGKQLPRKARDFRHQGR